MTDDKLSYNQELIRLSANAAAFDQLNQAEPLLVDVQVAGDVVPGFASNTILTSGPPMAWDEYEGGQRAAILGAAQFEGLARSEEEAEHAVADGRINIATCHEYKCVGSLAGVYSASMPVFVVRNQTFGNVAYCNFYEGSNPRRLNYGVYDEDVRARLEHINRVIAPVVADAIREAGPIPLKPIMKRALHMGDELHSRNTAASLLFAQTLIPYLMRLKGHDADAIAETIRILSHDSYFFLRLSMAAAKSAAVAAHGVVGSSLVTAMAFNCKRFGIRVSGLGDQWFEGPLPTVQAKLFENFTRDDIAWMGGESTITETVGLGGFAQAAAFPLQSYQGGSPEYMIETNLSFYAITEGDNPYFKIPFFSYRGTPTGIDIFKVISEGIMPGMDIGIAGRNGGQIGAGLVTAQRGCFDIAAKAYRNVNDTDKKGP